MLLYFPSLLPQSLSDEARQALPEAVRFLDPGLARPGSPEHLMPEAAPFDRRHAKALLNDTLSFGMSMASPRDVAVQGLLKEDEAMSREGSLAVLGEVERAIAGNAAGDSTAQAADPLDQARRQAQMLLLLAWNLEERAQELKGIGQGISDSWERLGRSVSLGEADVDDESDQDALTVGRLLSGLGVPDAAPEPAPWRRVLEAMAVLAPGAVFCTADPNVAAELAEAGVLAAAEPAEVRLEGVTEPIPARRAPAWRLLGLDRAPEDRPWLEAQLAVAVLLPAGQGA